MIIIVCWLSHHGLPSAHGLLSFELLLMLLIDLHQFSGTFWVKSCSYTTEFTDNGLEGVLVSLLAGKIN